MKRIFTISSMVVALTMFFASCVKDLDTQPIDPDDLISANVYKTPSNYKLVLAKCYAGLSLSGQQGPAGKPDIRGIDEGFGEYLRGYWYHQELTTDEAVIGWNDKTIKNFHSQTWGSSDVFIQAMYYRIFYQICLCNEFIRESADAKLAERGITGADAAAIKQYRLEARFLRALSYYHALDLFGNVPFVTDLDPVGKFFPQQKDRPFLFNYIEGELLAIENEMTTVKGEEYGRAGQGAVWALLAKLYLNSTVYTGIDKNAECLTYCNKIINSGAYSLDPVYQNLFTADNNISQEPIFMVNFDGISTQSWGGTTFIVHSAVGGSMVPGDYGIGGGWGGTRTTSALVEKFYPAGKMPWHSPKPHKKVMDYPTLYVPGGYQGWDPANTTTVLKSVASDNKFEGYLYFPDANTEFKFCQNPNWDVNWGDDGADGTLDPGGANIKAVDAGYYKINVDLTALTYTILKTTWGIIGSATPTGWDSDTPMTYDAATGTWSIVMDLVAGEIKFRANGGWDLNYGDDGANGIMEAGGANIAIPSAGNYKISIKLGAPDYTYTIELVTPPSIDHRPIFYTNGQSLEINDVAVFTDGYAVPKFTNMTSGGQAGKDATFVDTDFPMFRLGEIYLMAAEAILRINGDKATAVNYVNLIRERAYQDQSGNITESDLTLQFILDERARELYWEGYRRTDLIRFGQFTEGYIWPWKGGVKEGSAVSSIYNLFPIPAADVNANPNLIQNPGY